MRTPRSVPPAVTALLVAALALLVSGRLGAQTLGDAFSYDAVMRTPIGALPPLVTSTIAGEAQSSTALAIRYGYLSSTPRLNDFGATAVMPLGLGSTLSATAGLSALSGACGAGSCASDNALMLSVGGDTRLTEMPLGTGTTPARLGFALNGEVGYARPRARRDVAAEVGLPISLVQGGLPRDALRIVPFVTPEFTFSDVSFDNGPGSGSGARFAVGGGVGVSNPTSSVGVSFGFQYVAIQGAQAQIGLAVTLGGR